MGYSFSALKGPAHLYGLRGSAMSALLAVLDETGVLDHETREPEASPELQDWLERNPDWEPEDDDLPDVLVARLSFPSPDPYRVPLAKLFDNYGQIVTAREAGLLADALDRALAAGPGAWPRLSDLVWLRDLDLARREREVTELLEDFRGFCREAERQGGFWAN